MWNGRAPFAIDTHLTHWLISRAAAAKASSARRQVRLPVPPSRAPADAVDRPNADHRCRGGAKLAMMSRRPIDAARAIRLTLDGTPDCHAPRHGAACSSRSRSSGAWASSSWAGSASPMRQEARRRRRRRPWHGASTASGQGRAGGDTPYRDDAQVARRRRHRLRGGPGDAADLSFALNGVWPGRGGADPRRRDARDGGGAPAVRALRRVRTQRGTGSNNPGLRRGSDWPIIRVWTGALL